MNKTIRYPRKIVIRKIFQWTAHLLVRLLTRTSVTGLEDYPRSGPLIVVGNHTGVLEVVLMAAFTPRLIEFMGSVDIPHERFLAVFIEGYGFIPVQRGNVSREAMQLGLEVLKQGGVIGVFPEGGIWEPAIRTAHSGVSWLSYHAQAPVLPIGFSSMQGALNKVFAFKFPHMGMHIGKPLPPVQMIPGKPRKQQLEEAAQAIMDAVYELIPEEERQPEERILDERFELLVSVKGKDVTAQALPPKIRLDHGDQFAKLIHRPTLFNNLRDNLSLPVQALKELDRHPGTNEIITAIKAILGYLESDNPYYFTYRYGQREGDAFEQGLREVLALAEWAEDNGCTLSLTPRRCYRLEPGADEIVEDTPSEIKKL